MADKCGELRSNSGWQDSLLNVADKVVSAFVDALANRATAPSVGAFFDEWRRLFGIVYGEHFGRRQAQEARELAARYGVPPQTDFQQLLFCVHTYFALLMKLMAAELIASAETSFCHDLAHSDSGTLQEHLKNIESGGIYARRGIGNFLQGEFFRWYLDARSPRLDEAIREVARALANFEPAAIAIRAGTHRDLLKKLYQSLVPPRVRHSLGEYYTPDWLAELLLDEARYHGDPRKRLLDPACGSGTFLVLAIQRAKQHAEEHGESALETARRIAANIWGFDLNPLAVIAARTNYLFALGDLLNELESVEIPVHLADSVLRPQIIEKFDFVVGNPPWIRWGCLSQDYREATLPMWKDYGLFSLKGHRARLGAGEKDFSMLFTYAALDLYLKPKGKLAFLITQEVLKSKGAGEGFRRFALREDEPFRIMKAHDLVAVQPFEGAANKTALIVAKKGEKPRYPVPYTVWNRKKGIGRVPTDASLQEALPLLRRRRLAARPMGKPTGAWQTFSPAQKKLLKIGGDNPYRAYRGASTEPYGVFWIELKEVLPGDKAIVRNLAERGKRKVPSVTERVEAALLFPAACGADIDRWSAHPKSHILMTQDPQTRRPYPMGLMRKKWEETLGYLMNFREILLSRGSRTVRELAERTEFYAMYGIGPYTVAPYRVVWKRMASDLVAAVVSQFRTPFGLKSIIPTDTTSLFALDDEDEAHYLCAILNSTPVREFVKTFSAAGRGFGAPSVMQHIGIPPFDKQSKLHRALARTSKTLHDLRSRDEPSKMSRLEEELARSVGALFGIA